jgi:multidrug efflux pump subunit AcrA (membrane-fusion protein)
MCAQIFSWRLDMQKKWIAFLVRPCLFVCLMMILAGCASGAPGGPTPTPIPQLVSTQQVTFKVTRGAIEAQQDISGEVVTAEQDKLFFRASGNIDQINVKTGDFFKKGDVLAELQISDLLDQLQQAQIDLKVAQDNLNIDKLQKAYNLQNAQSDAVIAQKNVDLATIALTSARGTQWQTAEINLEIAQEKLKTAQAMLELVKGEVNSNLQQVVDKNQLAVERLQKQIGDRQLIAPYDGVVLQIRLTPGISITAYDDTVALVGNPTQLIIQVPWDNQLSTTLTPLTPVSLFMNQDKSKLYPVKYIPEFLPISTSTGGITTGSTGTITLNFLYFSAPADLTYAQLPVGNRVNLHIILGSKQDALLLPPPAIRGNDVFKYVIVLEDNYHRRVEVVSIGIQTIQAWEVISPNLKEGDVILGPNQ